MNAIKSEISTQGETQAETQGHSQSKFTSTTAITIVVANMVGTGVFTSLGYQLVDIRSVFVLMLLWFLGGIAALCGALCYAELSSRLPRSGGEYNFLSEIFHPSIGFVSGWVSTTVGFAAPTALAAMTFGAYLAAALEQYVEINRSLAAIVLVVALSMVHGVSRGTSGGFQKWMTFAKVSLILVFCTLVVWFVSDGQPMDLMPVASDGALMTGSAFAVALIYVNYAYTGWNAATYLTSEVAEPRKTLPRVLIIGTMLVMALYLGLNAVFLYAVPMEALVGKIEIGVIVAQTVFGTTGGLVMGFVLALMLVSTVSAMVMVGPRVLQVIGEDHRAFRLLSKTNAQGVPWVGILFQAVLTIMFILTSSFESVLLFSGFVLGFNSLATVIALLVLRRRQGPVDGIYQTFAYPLPPLIYIAIMLWTLIFVSTSNPMEAGGGMAIILIGLLIYYLQQAFGRKTT